MKQKEMKKIMNHFDRYFEQNDCIVIHPVVDEGLHIDVLLYKPNQKYPFWKMVTMGASDYKMPELTPTVGNFNEYMMFIDKDEDLNNRETAKWYHDKLVMIASYAYKNNCHITFNHSFEWTNDDPNDDKIGAFVLFPESIENVEILRCKTGLLKKVAYLEVVLLNKTEIDLLIKIGPQEFWHSYIYPTSLNE